MDSKLLEFKTKALEDNIPIMRDEVINYIKKLITNYKLKNILEIGTAVGYSAVNFALTKSDVKITTIERDQKRFLAAVKNVKSFGLEDRIELVLSDALETSLDTEEKFDLIIIDAAKGKNIDFFNKFKENLKIGGLIITDNTLFHGLVGNSETIESKNLRSLVKKIEKYIEFLKTNEEYETVFLELGDGIAISKKEELMSTYIAIPNNKKNIKLLKQKGFNSFILPLKDYSIGFENYYSVKEINELAKKYHISIIINKFLHKDDLNKIIDILKDLRNIKGYFIEDLSLLSYLNKKKIIINQNHIINNSRSINTFNSLGFKNIVISNELTIDEIKEIRKNTDSKLFYFYINKNTLLYSRRTLISNYNKNYKNVKNNKIMNIKEAVTNHELLVKEEENSTIIFNGEVFNASIHNKELEENIDYLIINFNNLTKEEFKNILENKYFGECLFLEEKIKYKVKEEK